MLILWLFLRGLGDRWWLATILLFGPRWMALLPLVVLIPASALGPRRVLPPLAVGLALAVGPVMGFCLPWRSWLGAGSESHMRIRILSCNVHYANLHPDALFDLIAAERPQIVALQEWGPHHDAPATRLGAGWHVHRGESTCLISRFPILEVEALNRDQLGGKGDAVRYVLQGPAGPLSFLNLHPISPREGLQAMVDNPLRAARDVEANLEVRRRESEASSRWAASTQGPVLVAGDLNLPCDSAIYRRYWSEYADGFSIAGLGFGHTWFSRWHGVRIDHILGGPGLSFRRCWVGPEVGSDHRPLIADIEWTGARDQVLPRRY
jgi:endonuclease/exonuclease/phosphatase (EEP) superfamily protein YafD